MTTNNDKNAVGGWGGFVYFRASLRPAQAGTAFRGGVFARPAQAGTDANGLINYPSVSRARQPCHCTRNT